MEDGRNFLRHTLETYDVLSLELGQIFRPGVAAFYTREFYQRVRDRLRPGGLVSQFVPLPFLTVDQFREELRRYIAKNLSHGFAITEEGPSQAYVSAFQRLGRMATDDESAASAFLPP